MHGAPKLMIIAKREAAGDLMPDFSGPGYHEARKCAIHGESEKMDPVGDGDMDLRETLMDISKKLEKASAMHQEQSEQLLGINTVVNSLCQCCRNPMMGTWACLVGSHKPQVLQSLVPT